jgi:flagellar biogenesis protein FliO
MLFLGLHILKKYRFGRSRRQPLIQVLETHYLAPKATLHLVAVGSTRFLVGNAGERLTLLTALPVPEEDQEEAMTGQMGSLADPAP